MNGKVRPYRYVVFILAASFLATPAAGASQTQCQGAPVDQGKGGTNGNDHYIGDSSMNSMAGDAGDDHLEGLGQSDFLCGNADSDNLEGGGGTDYLNGGDNVDAPLSGDDGDDIIHAGGYGDTIHGNQGWDLVGGDDGPDDIFGDTGTLDSLFDGGSAHSDTLTGGGGADYFYLCPDGKSDTIADFNSSELDQKIFLTSDPSDPNHNLYLEWCA